MGLAGGLVVGGVVLLLTTVGDVATEVGFWADLTSSLIELVNSVSWVRCVMRVWSKNTLVWVGLSEGLRKTKGKTSVGCVSHSFISKKST